MKRVFIICPVRNIDDETKETIEKYVLSLEDKGCVVHWPPRDPNQDDPIGLDICKQNREAIWLADEVHIWLDRKSKGSLLDLGMRFSYYIIFI